MRILLLEPFLEGSHREWVNGLVRHSSHTIEVLSLPGRHWKWRMHGAAPHFAFQMPGFKESFDLLVASDFLDLAAFLGLSRSITGDIPTAIYFHENQLSYPWSPQDPDTALQRDRHYAFINLTSALAANSVIFSTNYQKSGFLNALPEYLSAYPDYRLNESAALLTAKSIVIYPGVELPVSVLPAPSVNPSKERSPVIVWNHRWEFDKGPELFFNTLYSLQEEGVSFRLVVLGKAYGKVPPVFEEAKNRLANRILHWGYCESREEYLSWLGKSDIVAVTNRQDFFGMSVIEAAWMGCMPLLPRRLAYPEIFGDHAEWYDTDGEFTAILRRLINNHTINNPEFRLRDHLEKYRWESCIDHYDSHFLSLISG
jgi:glycosyltransferase involved in cell wall biosynthesis